MTFWEIVLGTLFVIVCILLMIVVLLQKGRGGGLGAAFGGAGQSAFGTRTGDVFTWVTIVLTGLFLLLAIGTTLAFRPKATEVPAPTIRPAAAEITLKSIAGGKKIDVMITTTEKRDEIYYTTNGNEPMLNSIKYDGTSFEVAPGTTVKAKAFHGTRPSKTVEVRYPTESEIKAAQTRPAKTQPTTGPAESQPTAPKAPATSMPAAPKLPATMPAVN